LSLLRVERVSKRYRRGAREFVALREVSVEMDRGELVAVLGTRRSGRSTLLRVAAGLERPDEGVVRFDGRDLARASDALGRRLCFCHATFSAMEGERALDHVASPLLAQGSSLGEARHTAELCLRQVSAEHCASLRPDELDGAERMRVAIARALACGPDLIVVDDPLAEAGVMQSDQLLRLLRSLTAENGPGVLMSTDDAMCVSGAKRVLLLDQGQLRPEAQSPPAQVVSLEARRAGI
jgi:putative ABC transport system ATP-binding protein